MRRLRHAVAGLVVAGALAIGSAPAQAAVIPIELVLAIDGSGSISAPNYALQRNAYASVLSGGLIPIDGTMAIGVLQFSSAVQSVFSLQVIDSQATKDALVAAINAMVQPAGLTAIGSAINVAQGWLAALDFANSNQVIDVSTDGVNNSGDNLAAAVANATAGGSVVNCLGIGAGANCGFASGFSVLVSDFAGFESALELKIAQETGQVPEPATMLLLGMGLAGTFVVRRRRR